MIMFFRLCHKAVYIRRHGGTGGLQTPSHSSLQCADTPDGLLFLFTLSCPHLGKWVLSGSVRPGSALCAAVGAGSAHSRCRWAPGGGAPELCLLKTMVQAEQDHGPLTSVWYHRVWCVCVFLKRRNHKTPLATCQFQEMGS